LLDKDEVLIALYLLVTRFVNQRVFQALLVKNSSFKDIQPGWNLLFTEPNIFFKLVASRTSIESSQFGYIVLKQSLDRDYTFIIEDYFDGRAPVTSKMVELLLIDN